MKNCSDCRSVHVQQKSSVVARLFISIYMLLAVYFFTGDVGYGALIVFISVVIPYWHVCSDFILWVIILTITVALSVLTYPQEYGEGILELLFSK